MNRVHLIILLWASIAAAQQTGPRTNDAVIHVKTALNHITALQFEDPVTRVAAGSPDGFQIEWHNNSVLVKPLRLAASTDLLVWTADNGRYAFELDPPGDVKDMNFAVDIPSQNPKAVAATSSVVSEAADLVVIHTFLGSEAIDSSRIKDSESVGFRVTQLLRTADSLYIHYRLKNSGQKSLHLAGISAFQMVRSQRTEVSLVGIAGTQIEERTLQKLGKYSSRSLTIAKAERQKDLVQPGEEIQGVLVLRDAVAPQAILQLVANCDDTQSPMKAFVVF